MCLTAKPTFGVGRINGPGAGGDGGGGTHGEIRFLGGGAAFKPARVVVDATVAYSCVHNYSGTGGPPPLGRVARRYDRHERRAARADRAAPRAPERAAHTGRALRRADELKGAASGRRRRSALQLAERAVLGDRGARSGARRRGPGRRPGGRRAGARAAEPA